MDVRDAAYLTVRDYPGGAAALAPRMGKSPTTLCHEVNPPAGSSAKLGLNDALTIVELSDNWAIVNAFMARIGGIALRLPQVPEADSESGQRMARVAKEFADLMGEVATSAADGRITPNEMKRMERAWAELVAEGQKMMAYFSAQQAAAAPKGRAATK